MNAFGQSYLKSALNSAGATALKLLCGDTAWNASTVNGGLVSASISSSAFAGAAYHVYGGDARQQQTDLASNPTKEIHCTESSELWSQSNKSSAAGTTSSLTTVALRNAAQMAEFMSTWYLPAVYYGAQSIIGWNLALDPSGQPGTTYANTSGNGANPGIMPLLGIDSSGNVIRTPAYYSIVHFSRLVKPGAKRVSCTNSDPLGTLADLCSVAFLNPDGTVVAVVYNNQASGSQAFTLKDAAGGGAFTSDTINAGDTRTYTWKNVAQVGVPDAPVLGPPTVGSGAVTIALAGAVPSNNGSPITGYDILDATTSGAEAVIATNQALPYTTTGLTNGTPEFFTAKARNSAGISLASNEVTGTPTAAVPAKYLNLAGTQDAAVYANGNNTTTRSASGYLDVSAYVSLNAYGPASGTGQMNLIGKFKGSGGTAANSEYSFGLLTGAVPQIYYYAGSTFTAIKATTGLPSAATTNAAGVAIRVQINTSAGALNGIAAGSAVFGYSLDGGNTYTQLGTTVTGAGTTPIGSSEGTTNDAAMVIGSYDTTTANTPPTGKVYRVTAKDDAGKVLFNPDFTIQTTGNTGSFADTAATPNTWNYNGAGTQT